MLRFLFVLVHQGAMPRVRSDGDPSCKVFKPDFDPCSYMEMFDLRGRTALLPMHFLKFNYVEIFTCESCTTLYDRVVFHI